MFQQWRLGLLGLVVGLATISTVMAQQEREESLPDDDSGAIEVQTPDASHGYRIGLACAAVPPAVRAQLGLDEHQGLLVEGVLPDSPADRAGLKQYDVVLKANGHALSELQALVREVNESKGDELSLLIIRRGDEQAVQVTPELRPANEWLEPGMPGIRDWRSVPGMEQLPAEIREQLERLGQSGWQMPGLGMRQFRPGIVLDEERAFSLPGNFSMRIEKHDDGPAKIHVQRGDEKWEVTEDNLNDLPADLRPMVDNMLHGGGSVMGLRSGRFPRGFGGIQRGDLAPAAPTPNDQGLDAVNEQLRELREAIESLKNNQK